MLKFWSNLKQFEALFEAILKTLQLNISFNFCNFDTLTQVKNELYLLTSSPTWCMSSKAVSAPETF